MSIATKKSKTAPKSNNITSGTVTGRDAMCEYPSLYPAFSERNIPIIFASDNNFVHALSVALQSVIDSSSTDYNYDIIVLETSIDKYKQEVLASQIEGIENFSLRFINVENFVHTYDVTKLSLSPKFTQAAYYRLFTPLIFANYKKIIYLDCDLIVMDNLAELFEADISNSLLAAVHSYSHILVSLIDTHDAEKRRTFVVDILKMKDVTNYFNSGVLVFNIERMLKEGMVDKFLKIASDINEINHDHDQSILNAACENAVTYLDGAWNVQCHILHDPIFARIAQSEKFCSFEKKPKILHYTSPYSKPWRYPPIKHAERWWRVARRTPLYESIVYENITKHHRAHFPETQLEHNVALYADKFFSQRASQAIKELEMKIQRLSKKRSMVSRVYLFFERQIARALLNKERYSVYNESRKIFFTKSTSPILVRYYSLLQKIHR